MEKGVLDILTVIVPKLIPVQEIRWVKRTIHTRCHVPELGTLVLNGGCFGDISEKIGMRCLDNDIVARTNNWLERFHRGLNRSFPTPHPNIA
ncbi:hypothetical protein PHMEG_00034300 [Phytophthora megakarya]|uniref:Uncharacterized protein n=1 Tax=Phytophthora megakarya TaxID=4795 RepID=A0A225URU3_9STRA|nr:hypothetical protein PHMEG_00034300 [Phytophthora megakarya]